MGLVLRHLDQERNVVDLLTVVVTLVVVIVDVLVGLEGCQCLVVLFASLVVECNVLIPVA